MLPPPSLGQNLLRNIFENKAEKRHQHGCNAKTYVYARFSSDENCRSHLYSIFCHIVLAAVCGLLNSILKFICKFSNKSEKNKNVFIEDRSFRFSGHCLYEIRSEAFFKKRCHCVHHHVLRLLISCKGAAWKESRGSSSTTTWKTKRCICAFSQKLVSKCRCNPVVLSLNHGISDFCLYICRQSCYLHDTYVDRSWERLWKLNCRCVQECFKRYIKRKSKCTFCSLVVPNSSVFKYLVHFKFVIKWAGI